jgi:spore coat polysaccharide biosynthesis protein SpsF
VTRPLAILQARMGSTRLPGKVLAPIEGRPMLEHILRRARAARSLGAVVVATGVHPADDPIAALAAELGVACVRGSDSDVLDRFRAAIELHPAPVIVRLTGDNPLVDGGFIDWTMARFQEAGVAYADTTTSATFPYGLSVEVVSRAALAAAWTEARAEDEREHVTLFIRRRPERFPILHLAAPAQAGDLRWTVDTAEDLERVRRLYAELRLGELDLGHEAVIRHQRQASARTA